MKQQSIRRFATIAVAASVVGGLAACSAPGGQPSDEDLAPADGTAEVLSDSITVWANPADPEAVKNIYARFTEATGVEVEVIEMPQDTFEATVQTRWASGERPDVLEYFATSLFWALNPKENLYDLSDMPFVEREAELLEQSGSFQGSVYAAVTDTPALFGLFFNKDVFAEYGLEIPQTYDDLAGICSTLQAEAPGVAPIFEAGGSAWPTQILGGLMYMSQVQADEAWDQQVIDKETTFDAEGSPFVAGTAAYKQFQDDGCFNSDATTAVIEDGIAAVARGDAAMVALPSGMIDMFTAQLGDDVELRDETIGFAYPSSERAVAVWSPNVAGTFLVPKTGDIERESTALAFIDWITGEGYQEFVDERGSFPVLAGAEPPAGGIVGLNAEIEEAYNSSSAFAFNSNLSGFNSQWANYLPGLLAGTETPESIAEQSQTVFEQAASAAGLPGW